MQAIKNFFRRILLTSISPASYRELLEKSFWRGFWYLYFLLTLFSFIPVFTHLSYLDTAHEGAVVLTESIKQNVKTLYPQELEVTVTRGEVSTNVAEPYYIDLPKPLKDFIDDELSKEKEEKLGNMNIRHLVAIDTAGKAEDFLRYESVVLLTKHSVVYPDKDSNKNGAFKISPIPPSENFLMNKDVYNQFLVAALPYVDLIPKAVDIGVPLLMVAYPLIVPGGQICNYLIYLLFTSLVLLIVATVTNRPYSYGKIYVLSLYGVTLPAIVYEVYDLVGHMPTFLFSGIFLLLMTLVLLALPKTEKK
jgi:hypothetical protein